MGTSSIPEHNMDDFDPINGSLSYIEHIVPCNKTVSASVVKFLTF